MLSPRLPGADFQMHPPLLRRSPIEKGEGERFFSRWCWSMQPISRFSVSGGNCHANARGSRTAALIKAQAKDYGDGEAADCNATTNSCRSSLATHKPLEQQLLCWISNSSKHRSSQTILRATSNLLHLQSDLQGCDFSELTVRRRSVNLAGVNFRNASNLCVYWKL